MVAEHPTEETPPDSGSEPAPPEGAAARAGVVSPEPAPHRPDEEPEQRDPVDEGSEQSFPASDPPAHGGAT